MQIFKIKGHIQNNYLVKDNEKLLLLDGGSRSDVGSIVKFIEDELKMSISDLKLIVVSHKHPDHCGMATILRKKYDISIASFYNIDDWYRGLGGFIQHFLDISMAWFVALKRKDSPKKRMWTKRFTKPDFKLSDNDELPFFKDWKIIHTAGHTNHDICLFNENEQLIYLADLIVEIRGKCMLPFPNLYPEDMKNSLLRISKLKITKVLLAHGTICKTDSYSDFFIELSKKTYIKPVGILKYFMFFTSINKIFRIK